MNTTTITFPWSSLDATRFTEAFEDRRPIEHAGRSCVVLSRRTSGRGGTMSTDFEIAYLADSPAKYGGGLTGTYPSRPSVTIDRAASDPAVLAGLGFDTPVKTRAVVGGFTMPPPRTTAPTQPPKPQRVELPEGWTATGDRSCTSDGDVRCSLEGKGVFIDFERAYQSVSLSSDVFRWLLRLPAPASTSVEPTPDTKRSPVAVMLGSVDSLGERRGEAAVIVITHGDAKHWHTSAGGIYNRGGSDHPYGLSPATDAMLTAYFDGPKAKVALEGQLGRFDTGAVLPESYSWVEGVCAARGPDNAYIGINLQGMHVSQHVDPMAAVAVLSGYFAAKIIGASPWPTAKDWARVCEALHMIPSATADNLINVIKKDAQAIYAVKEAISTACNKNGGECDPGRIDLEGVWQLFECDVLRPLLAKPEQGALQDELNRECASLRELNRNAEDILRKACGSDQRTHVVDAALVAARRLGLAELTREKIELAQGDGLDAIGELLACPRSGVMHSDRECDAFYRYVMLNRFVAQGGDPPK